MNKNDDIRVTIGIAFDKTNCPMDFLITEHGIGFFDNNYSYDNLVIAHACLMDLADAIKIKMNQLAQ